MVITDGDATPSTSDHTDFGPVAVASGTLSRTFTINNTGNGSLYLYGTPIVVKSGTNAVDFTITQPSSATLAELTGTISFTVEFNPSGAGLRTAELSISNNDSDENPYNFSIQGTDIDMPTVITASVSSFTTTSATLGGNIIDDGGGAVTERGIVYSTTDETPTIGEAGVNNVVIGSGTGSFSQLVGSLTTGTLYYVNAYAINSAGISYGVVVRFTTQSTPAMTWDNSSDIVYGALLSATQLNATASVPGTYTYTPTFGTKLNAGSAQSLTVDFTPTDATNYTTATKTVTIDVAKATPYNYME